MYSGVISCVWDHHVPKEDPNHEDHHKNIYVAWAVTLKSYSLKVSHTIESVATGPILSPKEMFMGSLCFEIHMASAAFLTLWKITCWQVARDLTHPKPVLRSVALRTFVEGACYIETLKAPFRLRNIILTECGQHIYVFFCPVHSSFICNPSGFAF